MTPRPAREKTDREKLRLSFFASLRRDRIEAVAMMSAFYQLDPLLHDTQDVGDLNNTVLDAAVQLLDTRRKQEHSPYHALQVAQLVLGNDHSRQEDKARAMQICQDALDFYTNSDDIRVLKVGEEISTRLYLKAYQSSHATRDGMAEQWRTINERIEKFGDDVPTSPPDPRLLESDADIHAAAIAKTQFDGFKIDGDSLEEALKRFLIPTPVNG